MENDVAHHALVPTQLPCAKIKTKHLPLISHWSSFSVLIL